MRTSAACDSEPAPAPEAPAGRVAPSRLALVAGVWGVIGLAHTWGATVAVAGLAVALTTALGLAIRMLSSEEPRWSGLLAAVLLATSPLMHALWVLPQAGTAGDRVMLLKTMVIVCGLLLLARLGAGRADGGSEGDAAESA